MLPESPGRREEEFNKSALRNKIAAYRSKAVLKDMKVYLEIESCPSIRKFPGRGAP